jgi:hypothetical protein
MSDKIKKLANKVILAGKIAEFEAKTGTTKEKGIPYISIKGAIQIGDSKSQTRRFEKYAQESSKEGKESKIYPKIVAFANGVKSIAGSSLEEATEVKIEGSFATNDYVNDQDELIEGIKVDAAFFNDLEINDKYKGTADIEGYIQSIKVETKGDDGEETGRLRVAMLTTDFFGNIVPVKNIIVPKEFKKDFEDGYEVGNTVQLYVDFVLNKAEAKPAKSGGLGVQRATEGKSFLEMVLTGADSPIDEDDDGAISRAAIKIALSERKAVLEELKEKGYQGAKGKSISSSSRTSGIGSKPAPVSDEDIPF